MPNHNGLAERFEANRGHLRAVAYRMLGSRSEAEDAVQEAWLRLSRSDAGEVDNLGGWLTTVVARICLDMLRSKKSRREEPLDAHAPDEFESGDDGPEHERLMADSVGLAMLVVLETLTPAERVAFVLHDMFDLAFEDIAPIVGRTPVAARQLASRARRRVQGAPAAPDADRSRQKEIVEAFLAASRTNDFSALLAVLDPNVVLRADSVAVATSIEAQARGVQGAPQLAPEIRGSERVARTFAGRATAAQPALVDGVPGLVWAPGGKVVAVFAFTVSGGKVVGIDLTADPERIEKLDVEIL
jgi:RNA polymerase sigma-70 factor (ECF subfamily)